MTPPGLNRGDGEVTERKVADAITVHKWAIIGPYGNIWTPELFDKPEECEEHLRRFWGRSGFNGFAATPVEVTIRELPEYPRCLLPDMPDCRAKDSSK